MTSSQEMEWVYSGTHTHTYLLSLDTGVKQKLLLYVKQVRLIFYYVT